jgi:hypothetical protein
MFHTRVFAVVGLVLLAGALLRGQDVQVRAEDPPKQMEGMVKNVDRTDPGAPALTVTVKERQPTDQEDMFIEVDKDYRFRVPATAKVFGLDGKPQAQGLQALEAGVRVRIEYRNEGLALEVKQLAPR